LNNENIKREMKYIIIITILVSCIHASIAQDEETRIIGTYYSFEKGSTERLYGDNVVLRENPNSTAEAIDTLSIGAEVKIMEKTAETMQFNGLESFWYKVKYGKQIGYVLGGLIAFDSKEINGETYLVTMAEDELNIYVRCRLLKADNTYYGHESRISTNAFYLEAFDNRGIEGVESILCVNLFAEACGVDGGMIYLFSTGERLIEAMQLSRVADGGSFWFHEKVTFPNDEDGFEGVIYYERASGESLDEEMEQTRQVINTVILRWKNEQITPNIEELDFGAD
jgi:hypothetical protein